MASNDPYGSAAYDSTLLRYPDYATPDDMMSQQERDQRVRRSLAAKLMAQGASGVEPPAKGKMSWGQTLAPAFSALAGSLMQNRLESQDADLARAKQQHLANLLSNPPQGMPGYPATSSNESSVGVSGPVQPGGGEGVAFPAGAAKPPSAAEAYKYAINVGNALGGAAGADVIKEASAKFLPQLTGIASGKMPTLHQYFDAQGRETYGYPDPSDPTKMIQVGGAKAAPEHQPTALQQRFDMALLNAKQMYPNASEAEQQKIARQVALQDIAVTADATGGVTTTSKSGAAGGLSTPPMAPGGAPKAPLIPRQDTTTAVGAPLRAAASGATLVPSADPNEVVKRATAATPKIEKLSQADIAGVLQNELASEQARLASATTDEDRRLAQNNISEINKEMERRGVKTTAPAAPSANAPAEAPKPTGFSLSPDRVNEYRKDARNGPYLPPAGTPGVSATSGSSAHMERLNVATAKLNDDLTKLSIPELKEATRNFNDTLKEIAADPKSGLKVDENGNYSGSVPGFGGKRGIMNLAPIAPTVQGQQVRSAFQSIQNIQMKSRSGAAVVDNELKRNLQEMSVSFGNDDAQFLRSYSAYQRRLGAIEQGIAGGYAPIVRDAYNAGSGAPASEQRAKSAAPADTDAARRYQERMRAVEAMGE